MKPTFVEFHFKLLLNTAHIVAVAPLQGDGSGADDGDTEIRTAAVRYRVTEPYFIVVELLTSDTPFADA